MWIDQAILIFSGAAISMLGLVILVRNTRNVHNRKFASLAFSLLIWMVFNYLSDHATSHNLLYTRLTFVGGIFSIYALMAFLWSFPRNLGARSKGYMSLIYTVITLAISMLSLTPYFIVSVGTQESGDITTGAGYLAFIVYLFASLLGASLIMKSQLGKGLTDSEKRQARLLYKGIAWYAVLVVSLNVIIPLLSDNWSSSRFGPFFTMIFVGTVAYSIIKHKLFDIRLLVANSIAYVATLFFLSFIPILLALLFLDDYIIEMGRQSRGLIYMAFLASMLLLYWPIKRRFDKLTQSIFFRDAYNTEFEIDRLSHIAISRFDIDELATESLKTLSDAVRPTASMLLLLDSSGGFYNDYTHLSKMKIDTIQLAGLLESHIDQIIDTELSPVTNLEEEDSRPQEELRKYLAKNGATLSVKLSLKNEIVGVLIFGVKKSGSAYTRQDHDYLTIAANELAVAIQNARRFDEIKRFNETLSLEVDRATRELRESNQKLQELDQAKDEFISMASHQLRTPLTSVKGYLSMVLEGDVGKVDKKQREMLAAAFTSSQRMVYLIADLLNVSRLQTGKFVIEPTNCDLVQVVEGEIDQLKETARAKKLTVNFKKPKKFPEIYIDETKIRQVIMNFIDNAIYYTPQGGSIDISLKATDQTIEYTVKDNGIGVPRHEQKNLFTKFYRATNAKKARPDGTGLGLFMARKVIVDQGGALVFHSTEGEGSTFGFTFPRTRVRPPKKKYEARLAPNESQPIKRSSVKAKKKPRTKSK